jgi:hypothetical protein
VIEIWRATAKKRRAVMKLPKTEFNGIGGLRAHLRVVPICGIVSSLSTSALALPALGPFCKQLSVSAIAPKQGFSRDGAVASYLKQQRRQP